MVVLNDIEREETAVQWAHQINLAPPILEKIATEVSVVIEGLVWAILWIPPQLQKFLALHPRIPLNLIDFLFEHDCIVDGAVSFHARATVHVARARLAKSETAFLSAFLKRLHI